MRIDFSRKNIASVTEHAFSVKIISLPQMPPLREDAEPLPPLASSLGTEHITRY